MDLDASHGRAAAALPVTGEGERTFDPAHERAMRALAQLGFVQNVRFPPDGSGWRWRAEDPADDRALLSLLSAFDLQVEVGPAVDGVAWIALAMQPQAMTAEGLADGTEIFAGSGFRPDAAVRACLGEVAEFQSWLYRPGDIVNHCRQAALGETALDPWSLLGFTQSQRDRRAEFNESWAGYDSIPDAASFDGETGWSQIERIGNGRMHWLPTRLCRGRCPGDPWRSDSNGCAAGRSAQDAVAAALRELIERDAAGIWWYGRCPRPSLRTLAHDELRAAMAARASRNERVHLLDLTHDLGVPVVASILLDAGGRLQAMGFGCKADARAAAEGSYLEMCQTELSIAFARRRVDRLGEQASVADRRLLRWLAGADLGRFPHLAPDARPTPIEPQAGQSVADLVARLDAAGLAVYRLDMQRNDIGIPAVRVFAPGLCHYKPRLGFGRLVDVAKCLGWRGADFSAEELSAVPLLI